MISHSCLLALFIFCIHGSCGQYVLTQSPEFVAASPGDTVTMYCKCSNDIKSYIAWYQQKPGQLPKLLIFLASSRHTGTPARFSGSGSRSDYTLTITGILTEDAAVYSCHQGSCGDIVMTLTPESVTASPGDTVTMYCKASSYIGSNLHWYQQKPEQPPKLLFYNADNRHTGTPARFSGSGSGADYTLTITGILAEDAALYSCHQGYRHPLTQ
uniref:Ig-like domain-containing protein n=1 Tax=Leptobrachium leishanense TaxID=445787 RepID=A0A8C5MHZ1_9ANUR